MNWLRAGLILALLGYVGFWMFYAMPEDRAITAELQHSKDVLEHDCANRKKDLPNCHSFGMKEWDEMPADLQKHWRSRDYWEGMVDADCGQQQQWFNVVCTPDGHRKPL